MRVLREVEVAELPRRDLHATAPRNSGGNTLAAGGDTLAAGGDILAAAARRD